MTADITDDQLSAYLDGELDAQAQAALEARLDSDPGLRARLERLRAADLAIREALGEHLEETPERFAQMVRESAKPSGGNVVQLKRRTPLSEAWKLPIAAALALAIGAGGGFYTGAHGPGSPAATVLAISANSPLSSLLDKAPSAQTQDMGDAAKFTAEISYRAADGRLCREFSLSSAREETVAVACRADAGWRLEVAAATAPKGSADGGFAPVSGGDHPAIDAALDRLDVADPLSPEEEAAAIQQGWRP